MERTLQLGAVGLGLCFALAGFAGTALGSGDPGLLLELDRARHEVSMRAALIASSRTESASLSRGEPSATVTSATTPSAWLSLI